MPKLRTLSGEDLLRIFKGFGFDPLSQRGSHVKLRRVLPDGTRQILTIVLHKDVDKGTLHAIYRQATRYIPIEKLASHFYSE